MGLLQALEAIKVLTRESKPDESFTVGNTPSLLMFSAYSNPMFRSIRLRSRKPKCAACSAQPSVTIEALTSGSMDYVQFCGSTNPVDTLRADERISAENFARFTLVENPITGSQPTQDSHIVVDVREKVQFDLCSLEGSVNIPFSLVAQTSPNTQPSNVEIKQEEDWVAYLRSQPDKPIFVVCRLGNDSQMTVKKMKELGLDNEGKRWIGDLRGGLRAWRTTVDPDFPDY